MALRRFPLTSFMGKEKKKTEKINFFDNLHEGRDVGLHLMDLSWYLLTCDGYLVCCDRKLVICNLHVPIW